MKFEVKNLGPIRQAELTLGDLTVVCGKNNTGKTYIAYAIHGFFHYWHNWAWPRSEPVLGKYLKQLASNGTVTIPLDQVAKHHKKLLAGFSQECSSRLADIFGGNEPLFEGTRIDAWADSVDDYKGKTIDETLGSKGFCRCVKNPGESDLRIAQEPDSKGSASTGQNFFGDHVQWIVMTLLFGDHVPQSFVASTERTGASIFQKELDFSRSRLVDVLRHTDIVKEVPRLLEHFSAEYPIPVWTNIAFVRDLPLIKRECAFIKRHSEILNQFSRLIGGKYHVSREGEIQFIPDSNKKVKLSMQESSSAVRSMMLVGFYLKYMAEPGDLLIIDEPELNLHPENQRLVARLLAKLVNHGIKVFITTHSDYIIRELNTLIMLHETKKRRRLAKLPCRKKYDPLEFLSRDKLKVYMTQEESGPVGRKSSKAAVSHTLVPADVNENGISLASFDDTIRDINRIQDQLIWGE